MEDLSMFDNVWRGPGYYWIYTGWYAPEEMYYVMGYVPTEQNLETDYHPYHQYVFISEEIPDEYMQMAEESWDGPGAYVFTERTPRYDINYCTEHVESIDHLADGLFRTFWEEDLIAVRKYQEGEDHRELHFILFPEGYRGRIWYDA